MNEIGQFEVFCMYRSDAAHCENGELHTNTLGRVTWDNINFYDAYPVVLLEGLPVKCPACHGQGFILTKSGEQLIEMLWRHLEPRVVAAIHDLKPLD